MNKKRMKYIDIARAIAIILIVLGHAISHYDNCKIFYKFLYSFHVALFFIISGFTFRIHDEEKFWDFFKKKFKRIMVPYIVWSFIFVIPYILLGQKIGNDLDTNSSFNINTQICNIIYGNGNNSALKQNTSLWFLPALFSMEIFYYFIVKYINKDIKSYVMTLIILILSAIAYSQYCKLILPWGINTVIGLGPLFYIGYIFKKCSILEKNRICNYYMMVVLLIIGSTMCFLNKEIVSAVDYRYGAIICAYLSGFCLSFSIIILSIKIKCNKVLEYIGRNTMGILIFHKIFILIFQTKLPYISKYILQENFWLVEIGMAIMISAISIVFSLLITMILKRMSPSLIGERRC